MKAHCALKRHSLARTEIGQTPQLFETFALNYECIFIAEVLGHVAFGELWHELNLRHVPSAVYDYVASHSARFFSTLLHFPNKTSNFVSFFYCGFLLLA